MAKQQTSVRNRTNVDLREPRRYKVIIYNDDFTTMEFVVHILHSIFYKTPSEAEALMLDVHERGSAVVGVYSYDIATSRVRKPPCWHASRTSRCDWNASPNRLPCSLCKPSVSHMPCKRTPFALQKDSFCLPKGLLFVQESTYFL